MDTKDIKGLNVKKLSTILIVIQAILFVLSIFSSVDALLNHKKIARVTDDYIAIQSDIYNVQFTLSICFRCTYGISCNVDS